MRVNGVKLIQVKYELDGEQWTAYIATHSIDAAYKYIRVNVAKNSRLYIISGSEMANIDAIDKVLIDQMPVKTKEVVKEVPVEGTKENDGMYSCPWCGKEYKALKNLKIHIKKGHM